MTSFLHFSVDTIQGAIPLDERMFLVRMVMPGPSLSEKPGIIGSINLHGLSIPVYSLRRMFGLADPLPRITDHLIITRVGLSDVALWVDETYVVQDSSAFPGFHETNRNERSIIPGISVFPNGLFLINNLHDFLDYEQNEDERSMSSVIQNIKRDVVTNKDRSFALECPYPKNNNAILLQRAKELAQPEEKLHEVSSLEVLTFQLVYHEYAVELKYVRESVLSREITPVPGTPDHVIGVLPVRGEIIPLIDLRVLLKIPDNALTDLNQVIILTDGIITFGILADQITGIITIPRDQVLFVDSVGIGKPAYVLGTCIDSLVVINAAEMLADSKMIVDDSEEQNPLSG